MTAPVPPHLSAWRATALGLGTLVVMLGGFAYWAMTVTVQSAIVAAGTVETAQNVQIVQHPAGGRVAALLVAEGERVTRGQALLHLDKDSLQTKLDLVHAQLSTLEAQKQRLLAERQDLPRLDFGIGLQTVAHLRPDIHTSLTAEQAHFDATLAARAQRRAYEQDQLAQFHARQAAHRARHDGATQQRALIGQELADQSRLYARGLAPLRPLNDLRREAARLDAAIAETQAALTLGAAQLRAVRTQSQRDRADHRLQLAKMLGRNAAEATRLAARAKALRSEIESTRVTAPADGVIFALAIPGAGAVIRPAEDILRLIPQRGKFIISTAIAPVDIAQVQPGQPARVHLMSQDQKAMSPLPAWVTEISADLHHDPQTGLGRYKVDIAVDAPGGMQDALLPGMPAQVFITTGDQTPMTYLLQPIRNYFDRAFRES